jgi:hypothetical protein
MELSFDVELSGALFDGRAQNIIHRYVEDLSAVLGDQAATRVRAYLPTQYMYLGHHGGDPRDNPIPGNAGALAASVYPDRQTSEWVQVRGDRVSYGAWIEGDSSLNAVVWPGRMRRGLPGRFSGYHTFAIIAQELNAEAELIAEIELIGPLGELNA